MEQKVHLLQTINRTANKRFKRTRTRFGSLILIPRLAA